MALQKGFLLKSAGGLTALWGTTAGITYLSTPGENISKSDDSETTNVKGNHDPKTPKISNPTPTPNNPPKNPVAVPKKNITPSGSVGGSSNPVPGGVNISSLNHQKESKKDSLGIPESCTSPCQLTKEQLGNIKFSNKNGNEELKVEGLNENETVTLTIENVNNDLTNYPWRKKYIFKSTTSTVTIIGIKNQDIILEKDKEVEFKETKTRGALEKFRRINDLGIPVDCKENTECELYESDLKKIKFKDVNENVAGIEGLNSGEKIKLKIESIEDKTNYLEGKKYTFINTTSKDVKVKSGGSVKAILKVNGSTLFAKYMNRLEKVREVNDMGIPKDCKENQDCSIGLEDLNKVKFEDIVDDDKKSITGLTISGEKIKLKIEVKGSNKTYNFKDLNSNVNISNKGKVILLEKGKDNRFTESGNKLKKVITEDEFGIPLSCRSNQVKSGQPQTCTLTQEQLKKIKFKNFNGGVGSKVSSELIDPTIDLKIEHTNENSYPNHKKYTFDNTKVNKGITIIGSGGSVTFNGDTRHFYKEEGGKLSEVSSETKFDEERKKKINEVNKELKNMEVTGLDLELGDFTVETQFKTKTIEIGEADLKKLKFEALKSQPTTVIGLEGGKKIKLELHWDKDNSSYKKNMKFVFKTNDGGEVELKGSNGESIKIGKNKDESFGFFGKSFGLWKKT